MIIIAPVAGSVLAIFVIVIVIVACKYRQKSKKMRDYERHVEEQEMEIKNIFREGSSPFWDFYEWNKNQSYTEIVKFSVSAML